MIPLSDSGDSETNQGLDLGEIDAPLDPRLLPLVEDYQRRLERGESPEKQNYIDQCPELASSLWTCLAGVDLMHRAFGRNSATSGENSFELPKLDLTSLPLGDFRILREIGRGGMGVVYEAVQLSLGRRVALKVLPFTATLEPKQLQRFLNEAQAAAHLHHTNIVPVFAVGRDRGTHFYAMQFIDGISLAGVLAELRRDIRYGTDNQLQPDATPEGCISDMTATDNPNDPPRKTPPSEAAPTIRQCSAQVSTLHSERPLDFFRMAAEWIRQAAAALAYAHEVGIIHRDIKPGNLLLDERGNLWVTDFGLAQFHADEGLTQTGDLVGTLRYMSPEQALGDRSVIDARTDVYSLGATLYELLTLHPMCAGTTRAALLRTVSQGEPQLPRSFNRLIPTELETIVLKAASSAPQDRYASAQEMADDLQRFLKYEPVRATRPSALDRARKWTRRHPSVAVASVLLLVVIAAGSMIAAYLIANEQHKTVVALAGEKQRAQEAEFQFQQARKAVDAMLQISEEEMAGPPMENIRKRMLQIVLGHYEDFIEQRSGDPASQADLARVQERVKAILRDLNVIQTSMDNRLIMDESVQTELGLTPTQHADLQVILDAWQKELASMRVSMTGLDEAQRGARAVSIAKRQTKDLNQLLTRNQIKRFRQLAVQSHGIFAFRDPDVVVALGLTSRQRSEIRTIERDQFAILFSGPPNRGAPSDLSQNRIAKTPSMAGGLRPPSPGGWHGFGPHGSMKAATDKVVAVLTPEQLLVWRDIAGEPFVGIEGYGFPGPPPL